MIVKELISKLLKCNMDDEVYVRDNSTDLKIIDGIYPTENDAIFGIPRYYTEINIKDR